MSSSATNTTPVPPGAPPYKMEPGDPAAGAGAGVYYPAPAPDTAAAFQPGHGAGAELVATDFMQTLQTYMGQPVDMQHHEGGWLDIKLYVRQIVSFDHFIADGSSWIGEHGSLHPGFLSQEFEYG